MTGNIILNTLLFPTSLSTSMLLPAAMTVLDKSLEQWYYSVRTSVFIGWFVKKSLARCWYD